MGYLERMSLPFCPFLQHFTSDRSLVFSEGARLGLEPYIRGFGYGEPKILQRDAHLLRRARGVLTKVGSQPFQRVDARRAGIAARDLLQSAKGNPGGAGDRREPPAFIGEAAPDKFEDGFHSEPDSKPVFGFSQGPDSGSRSAYAASMTRKITDRELQDAINALHDTIGANVRAEMERHFEGGDKTKLLGKASGLGKGTVQRVIAGSKGYGREAPTSARVETLMRLAWYFRVPVTTFFVPRDTRSIVLGLASPIDADVSAQNSAAGAKSPHTSLRLRSPTR